MDTLASLDALAPGVPRARAAREWAARVRAMAPGNPATEAVAASLERAAWRGEIRHALPWLHALAVAAQTAATWSAEPVTFGLRIEGRERFFPAAR